MRDLNPKLFFAKEVCQLITLQTPLVEQTRLELAVSLHPKCRGLTNYPTTLYLRRALYSKQIPFIVHITQQVSPLPQWFTLHQSTFQRTCGGVRSRPPKHFTAPIVFKTSPSPTELLLHQQDVKELNPNLLCDRQVH